MQEYIKHYSAAIIVLHEIYGINKFIEETCQNYHDSGFDVYCPHMLNKVSFAYEDRFAAYAYFNSEVGFGIYKRVEIQIKKLKNLYKKVFVLGFSVGATVAWRCSENSLADGIICCYGSRIRDYLSVEPSCPTLLLFAEHDSFDVVRTIEQLKNKDNVAIVKLNAGHGFLDKYNENYDQEQEQIAKVFIKKLINDIERK